MHTKDLIQALHNAGFQRFDSDKTAESNLDGRTHYYDASTCRFFGSRAVHCRAIDDGLILGAIESLPGDTGRKYHCVFFDLDGFVIAEEITRGVKHSTKRAAMKHYESCAAEIDGFAVCREMLARMAKRAEQSAAEYRAILAQF